MATISTFLKENYQMICLLLGVVGVVIGVIQLNAELKSRTRKKEEQEKNEKPECPTESIKNSKTSSK